MVRGVSVLWRRNDGCKAEIKGCGWCSIVKKWRCRFLSPTYFTTSKTSCGYCAWERHDDYRMGRGVSVPWSRKDGCAAEIKGCGWCSVVKKVKVKILSPTHLTTSMPSCGYCAWERYENYSMVRGVPVLWRRKDGCAAEIKGCGGCSKVKKWRCWFSSPTYLTTRMPSFGYCAWERHDDNSMVRSV